MQHAQNNAEYIAFMLIIALLELHKIVFQQGIHTDLTVKMNETMNGSCRP